MMTFEEVKVYLKQRFPVIMVDKVLEIEPGIRIKTLKNVTGNEIFFLGHFPDFAIMPGVFTIEAIGQSASILLNKSSDMYADNKLGSLVIGALNDVRFYAPVLPGDSMILDVKIIRLVEDLGIVEGIAKVEDRIVAKGRLTFARKKL